MALEELLINTEPEWRLWDGLHTKGIEFRLGQPDVPIPGDMDRAGRAWFLMDGARVRHTGESGFLIRKGDQDSYRSTATGVLNEVSNRL